MPSMKIRGLDVHYEAEGQGEPLVLLHHGTGCAKMWDKLTPGFAERYRVIRYDRRGFGDSEEGDRFREYYLSDEYSERSVEELDGLLEGLGIRQGLRMVGQCEGGAVAFEYAARYPDRVKAVVSSSTLCASGITVGEYCKGKMYESLDAADPEFQKKMFWWHGEARARNLYALFVQMGGAYGAGVFDLRGVLRKVECPSLVLYPDRSGLFEVEQGVLMYRALPKGELAVMASCGHNTYLQTEEYQRQVLAFFQRHEGGARP